MASSFCKECGIPMKKIMHFEKSGNTTFCECPKCFFRTKPKKLIIPDDRDYKGGKH